MVQLFCAILFMHIIVFPYAIGILRPTVSYD